jgi:hypothetical protein
VAGNLNSALQSRGGDGLFSQRKIPLTNRLPEREIRGDDGGAKPAMDEMFCRGNIAAALSCIELQNRSCEIVVAKLLRQIYCQRSSAFPVSHNIHARPA